MLKILDESNGNRLAVRASDLLTDDDYKQVFIPAVEKVLAEHGSIRVMVDCDEGFRGWEPEALWDDIRFAAAHKGDFERLAIVGPVLMSEWAANLAGHFTHGKIHTFQAGETDHAWKWVNEGD